LFGRALTLVSARATIARQRGIPGSARRSPGVLPRRGSSALPPRWQCPCGRTWGVAIRDLISRAAVAAGAGVVLASGAFAPAAAQAAAPKTLYVSQGGLDSGTCTSASPCATVSGSGCRA